MKFFFAAIFFFAFGKCFSQADTSAQPLQSVFSLQARIGETIAHTVAARNIKGAHPYGLELQLAHRNINYGSWNRSGAFITSGLMLNYFNFDLSILGHGTMLSYFIQPEYRIGNRLLAYYRAGIGADYLSNPSNVETNPTNRTYSQHINPYMHVGIGFSYRFADHFSITANGAFHHTSNGEFRKPNTGINWTSAAVGLTYTPNGSALPRYTRNRNIHYTSRRIMYDAGLFYTPPQGYNPQRFSKRTFVGGLTLQATKAFTNTNAFTAGITGYYMHYRINEPNSIVTNANPLMLGIHGGHAFLIGPVTFSQQIGIYVVKQAAHIPAVYQQYDLSYLFGKHFQLGVGLRANADNADFSDVKLSYRF